MPVTGFGWCLIASCCQGEVSFVRGVPPCGFQRRCPSSVSRLSLSTCTRPLSRKLTLAADFQRFHQFYFFSIILIFLLCGQITWKATGQVINVPCRPQPLQKGFQVVFHITLHHPAALDYRLHERVVPGRSLASDVAGIL